MLLRTSLKKKCVKVAFQDAPYLLCGMRTDSAQKRLMTAYSQVIMYVRVSVPDGKEGTMRKDNLHQRHEDTKAHLNKT